MILFPIWGVEGNFIYFDQVIHLQDSKCKSCKRRVQRNSPIPFHQLPNFPLRKQVMFNFMFILRYMCIFPQFLHKCYHLSRLTPPRLQCKTVSWRWFHTNVLTERELPHPFHWLHGKQLNGGTVSHLGYLGYFQFLTIIVLCSCIRYL